MAFQDCAGREGSRRQKPKRDLIAAEPRPPARQRPDEALLHAHVASLSGLGTDFDVVNG